MRHILLILAVAISQPALATTKVIEEYPDGRVGVITVQGSDVVFYVHNKEETEITFTFNVSMDNALCDKALPLTVIVPPKRKLRLCTLRIRDRNRRSMNYKFESSWRHGTPVAKHDNNYTYALPYPKGKSYVVIQGYNGKFSHFGNGYNSLDWGMPVGTRICAARGGVVIAVKEDSAKGGASKELIREGNYIRIKHKDGTIGAYGHLKKMGAFVKVGQRINRGQVIGLSGNTGYTSWPHLHFTVGKPINGVRTENYKIKFFTRQGNGILLKRGGVYTSW